ncbi:MAG: 50S ribosome-binding GTPase [Acidimicrobiia bacterium]
MRDTSRIGDSLQSLAAALESLDLGEELAELDTERDRLISIIRSYLIPRVEDPDLPMMVVFAGPTGSGKSTLINSLTGRELAGTGVLRPTTTRPLVLASHAAGEKFERVAGISCRVVTGDAPVLGAMALVDTPDIDSVAVEHRVLAERLIDNADVVVFVTSALRYADDVPWQVLRRAGSRGTQVIHVLNRVGSATSGAAVDFASRLRAEGFSSSVITVPEHHLPEEAFRVPSTAVRSLARDLRAIAVDRERHSASTFDRVFRSVVDQVLDLARAVATVADETDSLEAELSIYLADRASRLVMADLAEDLFSPLPAGESRWSRRRWRGANRLEHDEVTARERQVVTRLVSIVHADLRHWIADEKWAEVRPDELVAQMRPAILSAVEGWVGFVARVGAEIGTDERWLTEVVLIDAVSRGEPSAAAEALFGDQAPTLVERARRELMGRLDVVYQHAGSHLIEMALRGRGTLDVSDLRAALGSARSVLVPIDA